MWPCRPRRVEGAHPQARDLQVSGFTTEGGRVEYRCFPRLLMIEPQATILLPAPSQALVGRALGLDTGRSQAPAIRNIAPRTAIQFCHQFSLAPGVGLDVVELIPLR